MANFIEEFFYGNLDPQARSTKQNKAVQKQMEILMNNEEKLTAALDDENKKLFLDFANAWSCLLYTSYVCPHGILQKPDRRKWPL